MRHNTKKITAHPTRKFNQNLPIFSLYKGAIVFAEHNSPQHITRTTHKKRSSLLRASCLRYTQPLQPSFNSLLQERV
jgi:hypothetical protein